MKWDWIFFDADETLFTFDSFTPTAPSCSTRGCRAPLPVYWQAARLGLPGR